MRYMVPVEILMVILWAAPAAGGNGSAAQALPVVASVDLKHALTARAYSRALPRDVPAALLTIVFPDSSPDRPAFRIREVDPGDIPPPPLRPAYPAEVLNSPGLHVALLDAKQAVAYVVSVSDPRLVLNERADLATGEWTGHAGQRAGGALAVRIPWLAGSRVLIFTIDESHLIRVLGEWPLPRRRHVKAGAGGELAGREDP